MRLSGSGNHISFDFAGQLDTKMRPLQQKLDAQVPPGLLFPHSRLGVRAD